MPGTLHTLCHLILTATPTKWARGAKLVLPPELYSLQPHAENPLGHLNGHEGFTVSFQILGVIAQVVRLWQPDKM